MALLLIALAVGALLIVGSQQSRLPAPFGLAANGHVAYSADGDIYTVDPVSGVATAVVTGLELDIGPVWSRQGTHLAFERKVEGGAVQGLQALLQDLDRLGQIDGQLFVARSDGRDPIAVVPVPRVRLRGYAFSPDGRKIAFVSGPEGDSALWIANVDGSGLRQLQVGMGVREASFRPPDGTEIVFASEAPIADGNGLYGVDVDSGAIGTILVPTSGVERGAISVAPDGSRIAYSVSTQDPTGNSYLVHVVEADGTSDLTLPVPQDARFQDAPAWSNDGARLVVTRGYATYDQDMVLAVVPADGSGMGVETAHRVTGCCATTHEWSPDDTSILVTPIFGSGPQSQLLLDPSTGVTKPAPWTAKSSPAWQRRAP